MSVLAGRISAFVALVLSGLALAAAFASEWWLGLVPCALCLLERWPYRVAIGVAVLALLLPAARRLWLAGLALVFLVGAGLGFVHVGVEQGWWPSPLPECAAPNLGGGTASERLARMPLLPSKPCDEPTFLLPGVPVSMAALNMVLALALAASMAISAARPRRMA